MMLISTSLAIGVLAFGGMSLDQTITKSVNPEAGPSALEKEVLVAASREDVWQAWTTNEGLQTFFSPDTNVELRFGGPFEILFDMDAEQGLRGSEGCRVLSFVPHEMLSFSWNAPPQFLSERTERTFVVVRFSDTDSGETLVRLTHGGWKAGDNWEEVRAYFDQAWGFVLSNLQQRFESGPQWDAADMNDDPPAPALSHFVYLLTPARDDFLDPSTITPVEAEAMSGHGQHLRTLLARDRLVFAGPALPEVRFPDNTAQATALNMPSIGIVLFKAVDMDEAEQIMEADPMVAAGFFKARVQPFALAMKAK